MRVREVRLDTACRAASRSGSGTGSCPGRSRGPATRAPAATAACQSWTRTKLVPWRGSRRPASRSTGSGDEAARPPRRRQPARARAPRAARRAARRRPALPAPSRASRPPRTSRASAPAQSSAADDAHGRQRGTHQAMATRNGSARPSSSAKWFGEVYVPSTRLTPWTSVTAPPSTSCDQPEDGDQRRDADQRPDQPARHRRGAEDGATEVPEQDRLDDQGAQLAEAQAQVLGRQEREQRGGEEEDDGRVEGGPGRRAPSPSPAPTGAGEGEFGCLISPLPRSGAEGPIGWGRGLPRAAPAIGPQSTRQPSAPPPAGSRPRCGETLCPPMLHANR